MIGNYERYEQGDRIQKFETKRPKIDIHTTVRATTSPLGLTLTKTPSFAELIETKLSKNGEKRSKKHRPQPPPEKLKASSIPAISLQIGSWKRVASYDGDVVVKFYYAKQKLVWEVLSGGLKSKMENQWLHISAIRATFGEGHFDILEIELCKPPTYFYESPPLPRKHTMWIAGEDFTGGQAQVHKRHILQFAEGSLERHYEKLLQSDSRLCQLSRRPFPNADFAFSNVVDVEQQQGPQPEIVFQQQQQQQQHFLHSITDFGTNQHVTPYQRVPSLTGSMNSVYSLPFQTITSPGLGNFDPVNIDEDPVWHLNQRLVVPAGGGHSFSNLYTTPEFYNQSVQQESGVYGLNGSSSSMDPMGYGGDIFMFRTS